ETVSRLNAASRTAREHLCTGMRLASSISDFQYSKNEDYNSHSFPAFHGRYNITGFQCNL
ncbi:hypothetical protein HispidOSU_012806, partial [Sigmodon hispidus]